MLYLQKKINEHGRKTQYYLSARCTTDCSNGRGNETVNQPFLYREQDELANLRLQKNLPVMSMSPTFALTLPLRRQKYRNFLMIYQTVNYIFLRLQLIYRVQLIERKSVIIFDEIQKAPLARQAIKHLVKDRRYDYIETGSLITVHKSSQDILLPKARRRGSICFLWTMRSFAGRWAIPPRYHCCARCLKSAYR